MYGGKIVCGHNLSRFIQTWWRKSTIRSRVAFTTLLLSYTHGTHHTCHATEWVKRVSFDCFQNGCPFCLYSLHVDDRKPGDRMSTCGCRMEACRSFPASE
ncbi:MAG: RNHCP domain-containing protein [Ktedonobacteraceae bacterium]